ncbi:hypothetical protein L210DRAFT_3557070 [Boletus edulis BED1]|uniref:Uncharacterized protein n=1 Tax=Boletus edulis BED1 TaxID=1328754 RepID=A0AAD4BKS0_BOLED|nr:hypothetical protein L210DRAFT_3557070 [Boletus edulis BED1]
MVKSVQFVSLVASASINRTAPLPVAPLGFLQELQELWAQYSPWLPAATCAPPPAGCEIVQVNLVRLLLVFPVLSGDRINLIKRNNGARYPEKHPAKTIQAQASKKIQGPKPRVR